MEIFKQFVSKYNGKDEINPQTEIQIQKLENEFNIYLPKDWKLFLLNYGSIWTPEILDIIVDDELDINDVQDFWDIEQIEYDKKNEWTSKITTDLIPFASDSMGNIFAFKINDIKTPKESSEVYFFDHDFDTVEKISNSFTEWINEYNQISE
jgi:hypothetical protein